MKSKLTLIVAVIAIATALIALTRHNAKETTMQRIEKTMEHPMCEELLTEIVQN